MKKINVESFSIKVTVRKLDDEKKIVLDAEPVINGKGMKEYDEKLDCFNMFEFNNSIVKTDRYHLFTCGCGDPGCAGFSNGVEVKHEKEKIIWHLDENIEESLTFVFNIQDYYSTFKSTWSHIEKVLDEYHFRWEYLFNRGPGEDMELLFNSYLEAYVTSYIPDE